MTRVRAWVSAAVALVITGAVTSCSEATTSPPTASPHSATASATQVAPKTSEQLAAEAATTAFTQLLRVTDAAAEDPLSRDWESDIRRYSADPAAYTLVQSARSYATLGLRQVGDSQVALRVTSVALTAAGGPAVAITGCYDSESSHVVHADTGEPVPSGTPPRYSWDITVTQYQSEPGQPWLVSGFEPHTDRPC